jgi:hypothetical protein
MNGFTSTHVRMAMNICSTLLYKKLRYHQFGDNTLQYRHGYAIMLADSGKETRDGDLYARRRILHIRRAIRDPQNCRRLGYAPLANQENARIQSCRLLESEQGRVSRVHGQEEKHPSGRRPEINKATVGWQWTTKKLTAFRLFLMDCDPGRNSPWSALPVFSIALIYKICQWLDEAWAQN